MVSVLQEVDTVRHALVQCQLSEQKLQRQLDDAHSELKMMELISSKTRLEVCCLA
jgi:hypothetical protein